MRVRRMRTGISMTVKRSDRRRLKALARDRNAPQKHVWRAEIVLFTAEGFGTNEIMRRTGKAKTSVWRWQERFMEEGVEGLLRDKTRPSRIPPLGADVAKRIVALTQTDPPGETTHWTGAMMAKASGISVSAVQRIWRAHGLRPHKIEQFKLSNDPKFVDRCRTLSPSSPRSNGSFRLGEPLASGQRHVWPPPGPEAPCRACASCPAKARPRPRS